MELILYHGSAIPVRVPEILGSPEHGDFGAGFYCIKSADHALRTACRFGGTGFVNEYEYVGCPALKVKIFPEMSEEWLDFIAACLSGKSHDFDVVEGPMADDTIFNYVRDFIEGEISRDAFWELVRFKRPTHQICFATPGALTALRFIGAAEVRYGN